MYTLRITTHVYRESNADADSAANEVIDNYLASPTFPTIKIDENWHHTDLSAHDGVSWNVSTSARDSPSSPGLVVCFVVRIIMSIWWMILKGTSSWILSLGMLDGYHWNLGSGSPLQSHLSVMTLT